MNHRAIRAAPLLLSVWALAGPASPALAQQPPASTAPTQDFKSEFDALVQRFEAAQEAHYSQLRAFYKGFDEDHATDEQKAAFEKKSAELEAQDPTPGFVQEFVSFAERAKGNEIAVKALIKVVAFDQTERGQGETPAGKALATLLASHIKSPELSALPTALQRARAIDSEQRKNAFKKLKSECPLAEVKANAMYSLGNLLMDDDSTEAGKAEMRQMFADLKQQFGTLPSPRRGKTYGTLADAVLFELDHLQLGMQAPDFEVVDETGAKFKLSDYKGKVVVVDFWGNW